MRVDRLYCQECQSNQKCIAIGANHLLHFLLSLATFGLWLFVWLFVGNDARNKWHCDRCGARIVWQKGGKRPKTSTPDRVTAKKPTPEGKRWDIG